MTPEAVKSATDHVNELVEKLDRQFELWDMWRTAEKNWVVQVRAQGQAKCFNAPEIPAAMLLAVKWIPLPVVPRRPAVFSLACFRAIRSGSKWRLTYLDGDCGIRVDSKTAALKFAREQTERSQVMSDKWMEEFAWVLSATKGVDFEYDT
jgi:hypothetical protein